MIRIAYVINYIVKNGPSSVILNIINNLDKSRYDISLITLFNGNNQEVIATLRQNGVTVYECTSLSRMKCIFGSQKEFDALIKSLGFDILHTHGLIPDLLASRLDAPVSRISTLHNNMYEDYRDTYGPWKSRIFTAIHLSALTKMDRCVCCSKSVYDVMHLKLKHATYIRNGIEPVKARTVVTRHNLHIPENASVFLYAGVLFPRKNVRWLIKNFCSCRMENEYLLILGRGKKLQECQSAADDHVKFLGFKSDPVAFMNISDVYVSASRSEGFSISVLEALSSGLGLFLSAIPSHKEVVEMADSVYIGEAFDESSFVAKLQILRRNYERLDKSRIRAWQEEHLSAKKMAEQYMKVYKKVTE